MIDDASARARAKAVAMLVTLAAVVGFVASPRADAAGNTFTWQKNGNKARVFWRSFLDDAAYMTVTTNARQLSGKRRMYVQIDFYALRCAAGMNTCSSVSVGGVVTISEGAEWHPIGDKRLDITPDPCSRPRYGTLSYNKG